MYRRIQNISLSVLMNKYTSTIILLFIQYGAIAQVLEGMILDKDRKNAVSGVTIVNKHSGLVAFADTGGYYSLSATAGDTLIFSHTAYQSVIEIMTFTIGNKYKTILMQQEEYQLKEATVSGMTKYQQDSASRHILYDRELNKVLVPKPKFVGLGCAGCFGWLADKITGNSKKPKRFRKQFAADDESRFIDSRYTPELITLLTGIKDIDSIAAFINKYPMEYEFARAASDLEIKAWIRNNYKQYLQTAFVKKE